VNGWWRRNRWGLVFLVPALALALWPSVADGYPAYWNAKPREPVTASPGGWVDFAGARMRLVELAPATGLAGFDGKPVALPPGVKAWRARIAFDAGPGATGLAGCALKLADAAGHTYEAGPVELRKARTPFPTCTAEKDAGPRYETVAHFVTPPDARPVAVHLIVPTQLPRYARIVPETG
jgi:hypothetical protein